MFYDFEVFAADVPINVVIYGCRLAFMNDFLLKTPNFVIDIL